MTKKNPLWKEFNFLWVESTQLLSKSEKKRSASGGIFVVGKMSDRKTGHAQYLQLGTTKGQGIF